MLFIKSKGAADPHLASPRLAPPLVDYNVNVKALSLAMHSHHSHSGAFCSHAAADTTPWSMLEQAQARGFTHYALTEHVPRARPAHLYPEEVDKGIGPSDLAKTFDRYLVEARTAAQHWNGVKESDQDDNPSAPRPGQMHVLVGAETENVDGRDSECLDFLARILDLDGDGQSKAKVDFLVGSVHHVHGIPIDFDKPTFEEALTHMAVQHGVQTSKGDAPLSSRQRKQAHLLLMSAYLDAQHALIARFQPEVIGHFDLCRLFAPDTPMTKAGQERLAGAITEDQEDSHTGPCNDDLADQLVQVDAKVRRNVALAVGYGALFEINAASVRKGWKTPYPAEDILDIVLEHGGKVCLSDDAHSHEQIGLNYHVALQYLARKNVDQIHVLVKTKTAGPSPKSPKAFPRDTTAYPVALLNLAQSTQLPTTKE